jgi:hypothetical protein
MNSRIKQYILIAIIAVAGYFLVNNHFIFYGRQVHLLHKTTFHLHYTFYSIKDKKPNTIMKISYLREAGIGDLLVELGIIDEEQKTQLESEYAYD